MVAMEVVIFKTSRAAIQKKNHKNKDISVSVTLLCLRSRRKTEWEPYGIKSRE